MYQNFQELKKLKESELYKDWRENILKRDKWTCYLCCQKGYDLQVHHILNFYQYPDLIFSKFNGVTLCKECHENFHKVYGVKDNNLEQLEEFNTLLLEICIPIF